MYFRLPKAFVLSNSGQEVLQASSTTLNKKFIIRSDGLFFGKRRDIKPRPSLDQNFPQKKEIRVDPEQIKQMEDFMKQEVEFEDMPADGFTGYST